MVRNKDRWEDRDLSSIAEYCVFSGVTASMSLEARETFNTWAKSVSKCYPREGTVRSSVRASNSEPILTQSSPKDLRLFLWRGLAPVPAVVRDHSDIQLPDPSGDTAQCVCTHAQHYVPELDARRHDEFGRVFDDCWRDRMRYHHLLFIS